MYSDCNAFAFVCLKSWLIDWLIDWLNHYFSIKPVQQLTKLYGVRRFFDTATCPRTLLQHLHEPKFHLLRHVTTRLIRRVERVVRVASCLFQYGGRRKSSSVRVYKLVFCALNLHQSEEQLLEKVRWTMSMSTPVYTAATSLNTCRANRACRAFRDERVAPCCPTSKMHGLDSVSWRDAPSGIWAIASRPTKTAVAKRIFRTARPASLIYPIQPNPLQSFVSYHLVHA